MQINQPIRMYAKSLVLTLSAGLVSAKLYLLHPETQQRFDLHITKKGTAVTSKHLAKALPEEHGMEWLHFDQATEKDLLQLDEDVFTRLTGEQVAELVLNRHLSLFHQSSSSKKAHKPTEKSRAHKTSLRGRYDQVLKLLGEMTPEDLGVHVEEVVSAVPTTEYGVLNPATALLTETVRTTVEALEALLHLEGSSLETHLEETLGKSSKSRRLIKKVQKKVKSMLKKISDLGGKMRIFDTIHVLTEALKKLPMIVDLLGPRLQQLVEGLSRYMHQLQTTITTAIRGAEEHSNAPASLPSADEFATQTMPTQATDDVLPSPVSESNAPALVKAKHGQRPKKPTHGSAEIEYDATSSHPTRPSRPSDTFAGVRPAREAIRGRRRAKDRKHQRQVLTISTDSNEWNF